MFRVIDFTPESKLIVEWYEVGLFFIVKGESLPPFMPFPSHEL